MKIGKSILGLAATLGLLSSTGAIAAQATRAPSSLPAISNVAVPQGARVSRKVAKENNLLGAPLFIAFLGAVAVTIGTIVIVNNNNDSPG